MLCEFEVCFLCMLFSSKSEVMQDYDMRFNSVVNMYIMTCACGYLYLICKYILPSLNLMMKKQQKCLYFIIHFSFGN